MAVRLGIVSLEAGISRPVTVPGLQLSEQIDFSHDQQYGPLTPWVVANARAVLGLAHVDALMVRMETVAAVAAPMVVSRALEMTAEGAFRTGVVEAVRHVALRVCRGVQEREDWQVLVSERAVDLGLSVEAAGEHLVGHLEAFVSNTLTACALQDVMSEELMLCSLGAWRSILSPDEDDPGDAWRCDESTTATLKHWLADLDEDRFAEIILALDEDAVEDAELRVCLIGSTLIRRASPPPLATIVGPGLRAMVTHRGGRSYLDQLVRLVAGLSQPPNWVPVDVIEEQRRKLTDLMGVIW